VRSKALITASPHYTDGAYIYAELSKAISEIDTSSIEETTETLRGAVAAEDRLVTALASKHYMAPLRFMNNRHKAVVLQKLFAG
jgi:hypothetical protein